MTNEKPDNKEEQKTEKSSKPFTEDKKAARKWIAGPAQSLIRWGPLGGSGFSFVSLLFKQEWFIAITIFPLMIISVAWAGFTESFLSKIRDYSKEFGEHSANSFVAWLKTIPKALKWIFAKVDDKYLKVQGNTCKDFKTEGYKPGLRIFTPLLNEVFVPLDLSSAFMRNLEGKSLPLPPGFKWDKKTIELVQKDGLRIWDILKQTKNFTTYRRLAILSWGGYGKTTLLRHITYIYTNRKDGRYKAPKLLPVLILLRQWQKTIAETEDLDLPGLIEKHHIPKLPQGEELKLPPNWAKNHLKNGKMLVMFDGFDEVKEGWRTKISTWLGREMNRYPETNFILTSRPSAYNEHFLTEYKLQAQLFVKPYPLSFPPFDFRHSLQFLSCT